MHRGKITTCTRYRADRAVKVCSTRKGHRRRCHTVRRAGKHRKHAAKRRQVSAGAGGPLPSAAVIAKALRATKRLVDPRRGAGLFSRDFRAYSGEVSLFGFAQNLSQTIPAVGKVAEHFGDGDHFCSGTLIEDGVVLTAAHCLLDAADGRYATAVAFYPGITDDTNGNYQNPYGRWQAQHWWADPDWERSPGGTGHDWGIILLAANADQRFPGAYTGSFQAYGNLNWNGCLQDNGGPGCQIDMAGYPADPPFYSNAALGQGLGQWQCRATTGVTNPVTLPLTGLIDVVSNVGTPGLIYPCPYAGGVSGGPVFTPLDGQWVIGGVTNLQPNGHPEVKGPGNPGWIISSYMDQHFLDYVNPVLAYIAGGGV